MATHFPGCKTEVNEKSEPEDFWAHSLSLSALAVSMINEEKMKQKSLGPEGHSTLAGWYFQK